MTRSERPAPLTGTEFTDRVMTAISLIAAPTPTRTFVASVRAGAMRNAAASLWVAWHLGTVRSWSVAPRVRARSFALVLAVTSVLASGSLAAAAAVHSVVPQRDDRNPVVAPSGSSVDQGPTGNGRNTSELPSESEGPTRSEVPTPSEHHVVSPSHVPTAPDSGHHATTGDGADGTDDHHGSGDGDATDGRDGTSESNDAHDGSDDGDHPAVTDDHDGTEGPSESDTVDDHPATTEDGSSGNTETPGSTGEPDAPTDGSGG